MTIRALIGNITIYHTQDKGDIALLSNNVRAIMFVSESDAKLYAERCHLDIIFPSKYDGLIVNLSEYDNHEH